MADSILTNCHVITVDQKQSEASSIAIQKGRIFAVGDETEMLKFKTSLTSIVDLKGSTVLPGLIEVHTHPIWSAVHANEYLDISGLTAMTKDQVWEMIGARIRHTPNGEWVKVYGYNPLLVSGMKVPTKEILDEFAPNNPVCVMTQAGHSAFFNSMAFAVAGVTDETPNPAGGELVRKDGKLTGMVNEEVAISMVAKHIPRTSSSEGRVYMQRQLQNYATNGYTTIAATGLFASFKGAYTILEELTRTKDCPVRVAVYHREHVLRGRSDKFPQSRPGVDNYCFLGVKFWADGSPYSGTMATDEPYLDNEVTKHGLGFAAYPNRGQLNFTDQRLYESMLPHHMNNLQLAVHAHGERALEQTLNVYEALLKKFPRSDHRYRLEHCGLITESQLERALALGVTPSFFPDHIHYYGTALRDDILGASRAARFMPLYTASRVGHRWSSHSDSPCCPLGPFRAMKTIVTRAARRGTGPVTWENEVVGPGQRVEVTDAIKAYTIHPAWQIFHEDFIGSIEPGKFADLTVVSENPLAVDPYDLDQIRIMATYKYGKKVKWVNGRM